MNPTTQQTGTDVATETKDATGASKEADTQGAKGGMFWFVAIATVALAGLVIATVAVFSGPSGKEVAELKTELATTKAAAVELKTELAAARAEAAAARRMAEEAKGLAQAQAPKPAPTQPPTTAPAAPGAPAPSPADDIAACIKDLTGSGATEVDSKKACGG